MTPEQRYTKFIEETLTQALTRNPGHPIPKAVIDAGLNALQTALGITWNVSPQIRWAADSLLIIYNKIEGTHTFRIDAEGQCHVPSPTGDETTFPDIRRALFHREGLRNLINFEPPSPPTVEIRPMGPEYEPIDEIVAENATLKVTFNTDNHINIQVEDQHFWLRPSSNRAKALELRATDHPRDPSITLNPDPAVPDLHRGLEAANAFVHLEQLSDTDYFLGVNESIFNIALPGTSRSQLILTRKPAPAGDESK